MLRSFLLFYLLFSLILFRLPPWRQEAYPVVSFQWHFDLKKVSGLPIPAQWKNEPFNAVYAAGEDKKQELVLPDGRTIATDPEYLTFVPYLGSGYFQYKKVGDEIQFFSRDGELLWRKNYFSYPVSDHRGRLIFLLTGDGNRIDIIDGNGNPAGVRSISGNFTSDLDFAARASAGIVSFAGGQAYVVGETGKILYRFEADPPARPLFLKSCALGPDGKTAAVHYLAGDVDKIVILEGQTQDTGDSAPEAGVRTEIELQNVYPHLLHFAVNEHGLLLNAPDYARFYNNKGREIWNRKHGDQSVYRPVFADRNYFVFGQKDELLVVSADGVIVHAQKVNGFSGGSWRILPGREENEFAVESGSSIQYFRYADG